MDAGQVLRNVGQRAPGLVRLALLLCPAVRIEPELIRAVRLDLIPELPAGAEGDLWFSPLVSVRGQDGIVLDADVANLLRDRARAVLQRAAPAPDDEPDPDVIKRAWCLIKQMHVTSPPVLLLEETVNWLAVSEAAPQAVIETELRRAVDALRRGRTEVARWAARALPRMPAAARGTTAAWLLAQGAGRRLASYQGGTSAPDLGRIDDLATLLPPRLDVPLGVSRPPGESLVLGDVDRDGMSVPVLDTDPRVVAVSAAGEEDERTVYVPRGARISVAVGPGAALLRTPRGEIYRIEPTPDDHYLSDLRRSSVTVLLTRQVETMGIAVAPDLILTAAPLVSFQSLEVSVGVTIRGGFGVDITGEWEGRQGDLALIRVPRLPDGVQPNRPPTMSSPTVGTQWIGLTYGADGNWLSITGVITSANFNTGELVVSASAVPPALGSPVVVNGTLAGMITSRRGDGELSVAAPVTDVLSRIPVPEPLLALTSAAQAVALELHLRFGGFARAGTQLDTGALMAAAGLATDQLRSVRGAAEWVINAGIDVRARPRWRTASGPRLFSTATLTTLDEAAEALRSSSRKPQRLTLAPGFSLTEAARHALEEVGLIPGSSVFGQGNAVLDTDRFGARGWDRLRGILAEDLPRFDSWDPWSSAPVPGAERSQVLLEVVSGLCSYGTDVPEPARTILMDVSSHLYPSWWGIRDDLARAGVPDIGADQDFPDFLEAYLGWCLTILDRVGASAGGYPYDMGFVISRSEAVTLPTGRFGLEMRPARPETETEIRLYGKFSSLVSFSAWVFLELADQVRAAATEPPRYMVPPPETLA